MKAEMFLMAGRDLKSYNEIKKLSILAYYEFVGIESRTRPKTREVKRPQ